MSSASLGRSLSASRSGRRLTETLLVRRAFQPSLTKRCSPQTSASPCLTAQRTFVSLNDLARLSPFGQSNKSSSPASSEARQQQDEGVQHDDEGYRETVTLPYAKEHLFRIVSDVRSYDQFVPYCLESNIVQDVRSGEKEDDEREFLAELVVGFGNLRERYTSKVTLIKDDKVIAKAIPTPLFETLETSWSLTQVNKQSTKVSFAVRYAFANPFYAAVAKASMHKMASKMIGAFEQRAHDLG